MPTPVPLKRSLVTVPAAADTPVIAANPNRRFLWIGVSGTYGGRLHVDATGASATVGMPFAGTGAGDRGDIFSWGDGSGVVPSNAFSAYSTSGTTIEVWEA